MKLRDFPLEPGGDVDIPVQFKGNQEMAIIELVAQIGWKPEQFVATADGLMTDVRLRDEVAMRHAFENLYHMQGITGEVRAVICLRGISFEACNFINRAMHITVEPVERGPRVIPVQMNVCRETFLNLLRHGSRNGSKKQ